MDPPHGVVPGEQPREIDTVGDADATGQIQAVCQGIQSAPHPVLRDWYGDAGQRAGFVRTLFDQGAEEYDRINRLFSLNTGARYRAELLRRAGLRPGDRVLDIATGTGLVAREASALARAEGLVVGLDISAGMLAVARRAAQNSLLVQADAETLPVANGRFDMVTMGYALRHVSDLDRAFAEFLRVLRPGGVLLLMEIARPGSRTGQALARLYLGTAVPLISRLSGGGQRAARMMRYYWDTIERCAPEQSIVQALRRSGFENAGCTTEFGLFKTYSARRPFYPDIDERR